VVGSGGDEPPEAIDVTGPGSAPRVPAAIVVVVAVLALLGLFGTVFFFHRYRTLSDRGHVAGQVNKVSTDFLTALTNFNANTIDADFVRIQGFATGDFASQAAKFFGSDVRQALAKVQATSRGQIHFLYVESIQGDTATVFGEVDQTIANLNFSRPEQDVLRVALTLKKLSAGWRVSEVTVLQGPASVAPSTSSPSPTTTVTR
jgi:hypothetical protein